MARWLEVYDDDPRLDEVTVLSCPACWVWQVDYTNRVMFDWPGPKAFEEVLEAMLREHVANECTHKRLFLQLAKSRGVV